MSTDYSKVPGYRQMKAPDMQSQCLAAAADGKEVVLAVRIFPSEEYEFVYNKTEIMITETRLKQLGYILDTRTVMNSKCSKLVLVIDENRMVHREVKAERIK
jgi:hypothetical protein